MINRLAVHPSISPIGIYPTVRRDRFGFFLVTVALVLLPLERVLLPLSFKPVDFILLLVTVYGVFGILVAGKRIFFPLILPFWLILIASLVATIGSLDRSASLMAVSQEIYLYLWFLILTNLLISFSIWEFDRLLRIWTLIAISQAAFTFMGMLKIGPEIFFTSPENIVLTTSSGLARGLGTFVNPNAAGAYLSISFFLVLGSGWQRWLRYLFAVIIFIGMVGSGSLGAISSTLLGVVALFLVTIFLSKPNGHTNRKILFFLAIVCFIIAFSLMVSLFVKSSFTQSLFAQEWFSTTIGRLPRSFESRQNLVLQAWSFFKLRPLGIGPNASQLLLGTIHNDYAGFLFERGLIGFTGWLLFIGSCLYFPLVSAKQKYEPSSHRMLLSLASAFFACAIFAVTHEISHFRQFWMLIALLFALCYMRGKSTALEFYG